MKRPSLHSLIFTLALLSLTTIQSWPELASSLNNHIRQPASVTRGDPEGFLLPLGWDLPEVQFYSLYFANKQAMCEEIGKLFSKDLEQKMLSALETSGEEQNLVKDKEGYYDLGDGSFFKEQWISSTQRLISVKMPIMGLENELASGENMDDGMQKAQRFFSSVFLNNKQGNWQFKILMSIDDDYCSRDTFNIDLEIQQSNLPIKTIVKKVTIPFEVKQISASYYQQQLDSETTEYTLAEGDTFELRHEAIADLIDAQYNDPTPLSRLGSAQNSDRPLAESTVIELQARPTLILTKLLGKKLYTELFLKKQYENDPDQVQQEMWANDAIIELNHYIAQETYKKRIQSACQELARDFTPWLSTQSPELLTKALADCSPEEQAQLAHYLQQHPATQSTIEVVAEPIADPTNGETSEQQSPAQLEEKPSEEIIQF